MRDLYGILAVWPIATNVAEHLSIGDLLNLSKTNSKVRAVLHGFVFPASVAPSATARDANGETTDDENEHPVYVRPDLCIGQHQTSIWKGLKRKAQMVCSEPKHAKGPGPKMCVYCSMPVCEGCIVRESFQKSTSAFRTRTRRFCASCWDSGRPHRNYHFPTPSTAFTPYDDATRNCCSCTAKDGCVCSKCRTAQLAGASQEQCIGEGCTTPLDVESGSRKICLWCEQPLWQPGLKYRLDKPEDRMAVS